MLRLLALLVLLLPATCWASWQECPVPIADVPSKVKELRKLDKDARYKYLNCLVTKHSGSQDQSILKNLKSLGVAVRAMMQDELHLSFDDDYDFREAIDLTDRVLLALARIEPNPVEELVEDYELIYTGNYRFRIIEYWRKQVPTMTDLHKLVSLQDFAAEAKKFSEKQEKTEEERAYISREAEALLQDTSRRYMILHPVFEGVYDVTVTCERGECVKLPAKLRFVVLNSLSYDGIVASLVSPRDGAVYFQCPMVVLSRGGTVLEGGTRLDYSPSRIPGQFSVQLDRESGDLTGELRGTLSTGVYRLEGPQMWSPLDYVEDEGPTEAVTTKDLTGRFTGNLIGEDDDLIAGSLVVRHLTLPKDRYAGTFRSNYDVLDFQNGDAVAERGVLNLVHGIDGYHYIRWALALRDGKLVGHGFSTSVGRVYRLELEKEGDITNRGAN